MPAVAESEVATRTTLRTLLARHVLGKLAEAGIRAMPLKGALFARWLYDEPAQRPGDDVDVLVRPQDFPFAARVLIADGFAALPAPPGHYQQGFLARAVPVAIDLHRSLFPWGFYHLTPDALFERGTVDRTLFGFPVTLPDPYDAYAHLIGHAAAGHLREIPRVHRRDMALLAERFRLDPLRCAQRLHAAGLARAARYALEPLRREDAMAASVLRGLPRDPLGRGLAAMARGLVARLPHDSTLARRSAYLTNDSIRRSVTRLGRRLIGKAREAASGRDGPASAGPAHSAN